MNRFKYDVLNKAYIGRPTLMIVRGLPGAGKSTFVKEYFGNRDTWMHVEADMYWYRNPEGKYDFDMENLHRAHRWCQTTVEAYLSQNRSVVVSNTFNRYRDIKPYLDYAKSLNCFVDLYSLQTQFTSIHDVPEDVMNRMRALQESHEEIVDKANGNQ